MAWRANVALHVALLLALGWSMACPPAFAEGPTATGQRLFQGDGGGATVVVDGRRLRACHSCHGRDGAGGPEGRTPALAAPGARGFADPAVLARAVIDGIGPAGAPLSRLMPRYRLDATAVAELAAYLAVLPAARRAGVSPRVVRFAVPALPGEAARAAAYAAALETALARALGPRGAYGRRAAVAVVGADAGAGAGCGGFSGALAVVGAPPGTADLRACLAAEAVPLVFPLDPLDGDGRGDPSLVRGLVPAWAEVARDLAATLVGEGIARLAVIGPADHPLARSLAAETAGGSGLRLVTARELAGEPGAGAVLVTGPGGLPPGGAPILLASAATPALLDAVAARGGRLLVAAGTLATRAAAAGTSLATAHAALAGERLAAALLAAGRDLTRDGLMAALAAAPAPAEHPPEPATLLLPLGPGAGR